MKYNLASIMRRAWALRRAKGYTLSTALKLAWGEAKGVKLYTFNVESERAGITAYIVKAMRAGLTDIHEQHKVEHLRAALLAPVTGWAWLCWTARPSACASTRCATPHEKAAEGWHPRRHVTPKPSRTGDGSSIPRSRPFIKEVFYEFKRRAGFHPALS